MRDIITTNMNTQINLTIAMTKNHMEIIMTNNLMGKIMTNLKIAIVSI
jgi:hypothetical protein